jgi:hypothetical protein
MPIFCSGKKSAVAIRALHIEDGRHDDVVDSSRKCG